MFFRSAGTMRRFHLAGSFIAGLMRGDPHQTAICHIFEPIDAIVTAFIDTHLAPPFFFPLLLGLPPCLPHCRILRRNSFVPHFFFRASTLSSAIRRAALVASWESRRSVSGFFLFMLP